MDVVHLSQKQLAARWSISEACQRRLLRASDLDSIGSPRIDYPPDGR